MLLSEVLWPVHSRQPSYLPSFLNVHSTTSASGRSLGSLTFYFSFSSFHLDGSSITLVRHLRTHFPSFQHYSSPFHIPGHFLSPIQLSHSCLQFSFTSLCGFGSYLLKFSIHSSFAVPFLLSALDQIYIRRSEYGGACQVYLSNQIYLPRNIIPVRSP